MDDNKVVRFRGEREIIRDGNDKVLDDASGFLAVSLDDCEYFATYVPERRPGRQGGYLNMLTSLYPKENCIKFMDIFSGVEQRFEGYDPRVGIAQEAAEYMENNLVNALYLIWVISKEELATKPPSQWLPIVRTNLDPADVGDVISHCNGMIKKSA